MCHKPSQAMALPCLRTARARAARRACRILGLLLGACGAVACSSPAETPAADSACDKPVTREISVEGALEIGNGGPNDFEPILDGDDEELVVGSQGGYMVTPVFRIDASLLGSDGVCPMLDVTHAIETREPAAFSFRMRDQPAGDMYWFVGNLPLFLATDDADLLGKTCTLSATFRDDGRTASASVTTTLVNVH
jgi:hypothetical protein